MKPKIKLQENTFTPEELKELIEDIEMKSTIDQIVEQMEENEKIKDTQQKIDDNTLTQKKADKN